jgi:hypothetical protein
MTPLTAEKIAELERLLAAATPRPWHRHSECPAECCWHLFEGPDMMYGRPDDQGDADGINSPELSDEDSALIVAAINVLPSLLSLAKRVAGAPVVEIKECCGHAIIGSDWDDDLTNYNLIGTRVALVEIVGGEEG